MDQGSTAQWYGTGSLPPCYVQGGLPTLCNLLCQPGKGHDVGDFKSGPTAPQGNQRQL